MWNPDLGSHGAWDTDGIRMTRADGGVLACQATRVGLAAAVLTEVPDEPWVRPERQWLTVAKYIGYGLSVTLLSGYSV